MTRHTRTEAFRQYVTTIFRRDRALRIRQTGTFTPVAEWQR